jgi:hypothetical protein
MAQSRMLKGSIFLIKAVIDYMFYQNRETIDLLMIQIRLDHEIFFHERSQHQTLFERIVCTTERIPQAKSKTAMDFFSNLWRAKLNPLVVTYHYDTRTFELSVRLLREALLLGVLKFEDYLGFFISALEELFSVPEINRTHIYFLLANLNYDNLTPIAFALKYFPTKLVRSVFVLCNDAYFNFSQLSREEYYSYVSKPDRFGLTALHYALKRKDNASLIDLFATMSLLFTLDEHMQYHTENASDNSYLDWISFYGNLEKLHLYIRFLHENLTSNTVKVILFKAAQGTHSMRRFYDNDTDLSIKLIKMCDDTYEKSDERYKTIFKFKLFSFPAVTCDGFVTEERPRFNP